MSALSDYLATHPFGGNEDFLPLLAIVPNDASILPAQAFVDAIVAFTNTSNELDVSNKGIKTISSALLNSWAVLQANLGNTGADFSGNDLDATTIAAILSAWDNNLLVAGDLLDLSGGTNAPVTYQPEFYRFQVRAGSAYSNNQTLDIQYDGNDLDIVFKTGTALAGSTVNTDANNDQWLWIGVSDHPTAAQIVTKIIALWATVTNKNFWSIVVGSASDQIKVSKALLFTSISITLNSAVFTVLQHQVGNADSNVTDLVTNGREVKFNAGGQVVTLLP